MEPTTFAIIGDYGLSGQVEADIAVLVKSWNPNFIVTTGDNNYPGGRAATIDKNVGQYYQEFIYPYTGSYGSGAKGLANRFWPSLGNHDWDVADASPYLSYFTLTGNERYYDVQPDNSTVHLFIVDSDPDEPDGRSFDSVQGQWLQNALAASTARWKLVFFHHTPHTSGTLNGPALIMRWPFKVWGANAVFSGHEHSYERLLIDDLLYITNGSGGHPTLYLFGAPVSGSQVRYNEKHGAMRVVADDTTITYEFFDRSNVLIDRHSDGVAGTKLTPPQRRDVWARYMSDASSERETFGAFLKADLLVAMNETDDWIEGGKQGTIMNALSEPCKSELSFDQQKALADLTSGKRQALF